MYIIKDRLTSQSNFNQLNQLNINVSNHSRRNGNEKKQLLKGSLYAGNKDGLQTDRLTEKKALARKQAVKTILDQFTKDSDMDHKTLGRRNIQSELSAEASKAQEQVNHLKELEQQYKTANGLTEDMEDESLKEYDRMRGIWEQRIEEANAGVARENRAIESVKLAKLKTHPMIDAQIEEEKILEDASKDITDMIIAEAKDQVDEEIRDKQKEAEEKADYDKPEEHKPEHALKSMEPKNAKRLQEAEEQQHSLKTVVRNMIKKNKLTDEDIKGLLLDEQR